MKKRAKRPLLRARKPPPKTKRCTARCATGKLCKNARVKGHDVCSFHLPGRASEVGKKGGEAVSDRWREVRAAEERLPIRDLANQARYIIALISEYDQKRENKGSIFVIERLLARLAAVTKDVVSDGDPIVVHRRVVRPELRPSAGEAPGG